MKKNSKIRIKQIVARKCKGFAFMNYLVNEYETPEDFWNNTASEVQLDFENLSEIDFRKKYSSYIY